jgi:staphylococcal nuclease domain-containing protein 1
VSRESALGRGLTIARFLRKRLIGKHVHVTVDYVKPKDGEYDERECVTVKYGGANA